MRISFYALSLGVGLLGCGLGMCVERHGGVRFWITSSAVASLGTSARSECERKSDERGDNKLFLHIEWND